MSKMSDLAIEEQNKINEAAATPVAEPVELVNVSGPACALRAVAAAMRRLGPCNDVSLAKSFQREADNLDLIAKGL